MLASCFHYQRLTCTQLVQNSVQRTLWAMLKRLRTGLRQLAAAELTSRLRAVGPFRLQTAVARFYSCIEKWGLVLSSLCKCSAKHKPEITVYRSVTYVGHFKEHLVGQFWMKKTVVTWYIADSIGSANAITIRSKKINKPKNKK